MVSDGTPSPGHRAGRAGVAPGDARLLADPSARITVGRVGVTAIDRRRVARGVGASAARSYRALSGRCAAARLLGRIPSHTGNRGVLAGTSGPATRPVAVPPRE